MTAIVPPLRWSAKQHFLRELRRCRTAGLKTRYLIVVNLVNGRSAATADVLNVSRSTVYAVAQRFRTAAEAGLVDRREDHGPRKLDERYLATWYEVVRSEPTQHGWRRPTWTRERLVKTVRQQTGVRIHVATMSVALQRIQARRGPPLVPADESLGAAPAPELGGALAAGRGGRLRGRGGHRRILQPGAGAE